MNAAIQNPVKYKTIFGELTEAELNELGLVVVEEDPNDWKNKNFFEKIKIQVVDIFKKDNGAKDEESSDIVSKAKSVLGFKKSEEKPHLKTSELQEFFHKQKVTAHNTFIEIWTKVSATTEIVINADHVGDTGYMEPLVDMDLELVPGEVAAGVDTHGRKILIQGTLWGNIIIFERYISEEGDEDTLLTSNCPTEVASLSGLPTVVGDDMLHHLFNYLDPSQGNWGARANTMINDLVEKRMEKTNGRSKSRKRR